MRPLRLAVVSTHPIQYYAPLFQALASSSAVQPRVFYTWSQTASAGVADAGFGRQISWDIPLLEGYEFEFVPNLAARPGPLHFRGLRNPALIGAIQRWQPDAVLVFGWNSESHLRVLRHFKNRIPVFFRGDSTLLDPGRPWRTAARRLVLGWVYRHIDIALAVGSNNRDYYRWCGIPEQRIALVPHAIDTQRFSDPNGTHAQRATEWRAQLGLAPEARTILFAGKLQPKKAPELLLQAFLRCRPTCDQRGQLIFVGDGVMESQLRTLAGGRNDVLFLPFQNQQAMPAVYRLGDVFVLPSRGPGETWGLALNEAMTAGRPVVASNKVGGARDLLREKVNGWQFESDNLEQLTAVLRDILTCDAQRLREMGEASQGDSPRWSIEAVAAGIGRTVVQFATSGQPD
jgi:glycosyltransferase involved in cell wall biosynthesis